MNRAVNASQPQTFNQSKSQLSISRPTVDSLVALCFICPNTVMKTKVNPFALQNPFSLITVMFRIPMALITLGLRQTLRGVEDAAQ